MKCTQRSCGKLFHAPLELYDGRLTCPHCKQEQTVVRTLCINEQNDAFYRLSELYFYRYLSPASYLPPSGMTLSSEDFLENAILFCTRAAKEGHPKAVFRMGFYNEFYMETVRGETERARQAFDHYAALCYNTSKNVEIGAGAQTGMTSEEFETLKRQAAIRLMALYNEFPQALEGPKRYDRAHNKELIDQYYGTLERGAYTEEYAKKDKEQYIYRIMSDCLDKERVPLFGAFRITGEQLKRLFAIRQDRQGHKYNFSGFFRKGIDLRFLIVDPEKGIDAISPNEFYFNKFGDEVQAKRVLGTIPDEASLHLYFFNKKAKHEFLSNTQAIQVKTELEAQRFALLRHLMSNLTASDFLFFCDDIVQYKQGGEVRGAVDRLIRRVCEVE